MLPVILSLTLGNAVSLPQVNNVPADALIELRRTSCFGTCPVYTVSIDAAGRVTYVGEKFVRVVGRQTARVDPSVVAKLLARADSVRFFDLRNAYREIENPDGSRTTVTDLPTTFVTITANGRTKTIEDYVAAPDALREFEREIDEAAGTKRWLFVDGPALEELARSGWSASSEEGATLLRQAIERDDVPIARKLIELGADLTAASKNVPPLMSARSKAMVELLVKAGANPNARPVGTVAAQTPLMTTAYKDAGVAEALLKAGANVEDMEGGRTALWYAACRGNWRVVTVLLGAGANPWGSIGMSALECAREGRQREAGDRRPRTELDRGRATLEDFDRVIGLLEDAQKKIEP
jgi:hypothetical protein